MIESAEHLPPPHRQSYTKGGPEAAQMRTNDKMHDYGAIEQLRELPPAVQATKDVLYQCMNVLRIILP